MEYISTSALANELDIKPSELFEKMKNLGWIERKGEKWVLTDIGAKNGGQTRNSAKYGEYIVWPEGVSFFSSQPKPLLLNATTLGKHLNISSQRLNLILSELGWIKKEITGWQVTKLGRLLGGKQYEHEASGGTYVLWPESILKNDNLNLETIENPVAAEKPQKTIEPDKLTSNNFREKFPATMRTKDGHMVRSKAEAMIDNALYEYKLAHAYERKLPIEEDLYSDFFIPSANVYIEFWGMENDPKYAERKKTKIEIYRKYDFNLIELTDSDVKNLDDQLPKKLLKYGIKVY